MASNLSCIGIVVHDEAELGSLVERIAPHSRKLGTADGVDVYRWEDPSGARLIMGVREGELIDFLPSFAGARGIRLADVRPVNPDVVIAQVVDPDGEQTTAVAFELEQRRALRDDRPWSGTASMAAIAPEVEFFADAAEFARSPQSLLNPDGDDSTPRMAPESFISYGLFGDPAEARAQGRLNATVLAAERRHNTLTGNEFLVSRVSCIGFEVDLLTEVPRAGAPAPGGTVAATAFFVASIDAIHFDARPKRPARWFNRR